VADKKECDICQKIIPTHAAHKLKIKIDQNTARLDLCRPCVYKLLDRNPASKSLAFNNSYAIRTIKRAIGDE
jgi:hypothetical protein